MADLISTLKSETGLDTDTTTRGLGAVLNFLKEQLPPELFSQVEGAVPQVQAAIRAFLSSDGSAGGAGLLGKVGELFGGLFGSNAGALPELFEMLSKSGLSLEQAKAFLPAAIAALRTYLPDGLLDQVIERMPGLGQAISGRTS